MKLWKVRKVSLVLEKALDRGEYSWVDPGRPARFYQQEWKGKRKLTRGAGETGNRDGRDVPWAAMIWLTLHWPVRYYFSFNPHKDSVRWDFLSFIFQMRKLRLREIKPRVSHEQLSSSSCCRRNRGKRALLSHRLTTPPEPGGGDSVAGLPSCSAPSAHSSPPLSWTERHWAMTPSSVSLVKTLAPSVPRNQPLFGIGV